MTLSKTKHIILTIILMFVLVGCSGGTIPFTDSGLDTLLPAIGSTMMVDGVNTIVVGAGDTPFEYVGTGESLIFVDTLHEGYEIVVVPKEGALVNVIPSTPSLTIDGEEQLNEYSVPSTFVLVEYDRKNN